MGENKGYKVLTVLALVLGIVGVTLGYAAFSSVLTISSSAEVHPDSSKFNVDFSSSSASVQTNAITPTLSPNDGSFTATNATINNTSDPTLTNLSVTFTEPGQKATYEVYAYNAGEYIAYLNSVVFSGSKVCTAASGTTQALVDDACDGITLNVTVGSLAKTDTSVTGITNHTLAKQTGNELVTVEIEYESGSDIADGNFTVTLPDIVLTYDSAD